MCDVGIVAHRLRGQEPGSTRFMRAGCGEPAVLIHGVGMNASIWAPQMDALRRDYDVIAYDMLGHGGSSLPPVDAKLSDYADQVLALMDGLGLGAAHVAGHSMGALVALEFALARPERVRSVVALNAVYCRTPEQKAAVEHRASTLEGAGATGSSDSTVARWFGDPVPPELTSQAELVRSLLQSVDPAGYARTYRLFATSDDVHHGRLERLAVPALFITGELDSNSTPAMSGAMAAAAPGGRCEIVPGERHMMTVTAPEVVNRRLRAFFGSLRDPQPASAGTSGDESIPHDLPHHH